MTFSALLAPLSTNPPLISALLTSFYVFGAKFFLQSLGNEIFSKIFPRGNEKVCPGGHNAAALDLFTPLHRHTHTQTTCPASSS